MEFQSLVELAQSIPILVWIVLFLIILFLFNDKQLWEYEAKFSYQAGIGRGEIEIEYYKKAKGSVDIELEMEPEHQNKDLEVFLEDKLLLTIPAIKNTGLKFRLHEKYDHSEPHEGMIVSVKANSQTILSSPLIMD